MLRAMAIIVLEVIALVCQRLAWLIFHTPPRSSAPHALRHGALGEGQVGDPTAVVDLALDGFPALQEGAPQIGMGGIERHVTEKAKPVVETRRGIVPVVRGDASGALGCRDMREQRGMIACFDA